MCFFVILQIRLSAYYGQIKVKFKQEFDAPGDDYVDIKENEYLIIVELKQELNTTGNDNIGINLEHPIKVEQQSAQYR